MTLQDIERDERVFLNAADIADVLGIAAQRIRDQAKMDRSKLGFEVTVVNNTVKIPRIPFIRYVKGE